MKIAGCTCSGKDLGNILGGAGVGGLALLSIVGGWNAQQAASPVVAWFGYAIGLALMIMAKWLMWRGMNNSCPMHSMHGMMAMMDEKPRKNSRKKR